MSVNNSQDCLQRIVLFSNIYELVSGEDGTRCMAFKKSFSDFLINLARDAVKTDVKKQQYTYILDAIQHLANDVDALGDERRQERFSRGVGIRPYTNATFTKMPLKRCTVQALSGNFTFYIISFL